MLVKEFYKNNVLHNHEVASLIPSISTRFKSELDLKIGPPSLVRTIGQLLGLRSSISD
jgi:hypothetical protein